MRKQLLGVFLPLLMLVLMAAAADTPNSGAATHAALQRLEVLHGEDGISVEITARGAVTPKLSKLNSPARVIVDLPNTVAATSQRQVNVGSDGVKGVRIGMDGQTPPTTRVVVDLEQACQFEVVPAGDGKFLLKLHTGSVTAKATPKSSVTVAARPVIKPAVAAIMGAKRVAVSTAATKPAVSEKKEIAASQPPVSPVTAPLKPTETAAKSATDYVFVEPSYKPKDGAEDKTDNQPLPIEPSARALEAAAKFADKPASELMQVNAHAAMEPQSATSTIQPAVNLAAEQKTQMAQQPAANGPKYTGEPISVNLKDVDL